MSSEGKVFGTPGEVRRLNGVANTCISAIEENNKKAESLLSQLSGSTKDAAYIEAEEVVSEVKKTVDDCKEPLKKVSSALKEYAEYLESLGI